MESDDQDRVSRRRFLQSLGMATVVGASGSLLAACGGGSDSGGESGSKAKSSKAVSGNCSDLSGLSGSEKKRRKTMVKSLQYVEESSKKDKNCANCVQYEKEKYGSNCGGCTLFPGPVAAEGYCNSWAPAS